jgi:hypothetical protein
LGEKSHLWQFLLVPTWGQRENRADCSSIRKQCCGLGEDPTILIQCKKKWITTKTCTGKRRDQPMCSIMQPRKISGNLEQKRTEAHIYILEQSGIPDFTTNRSKNLWPHSNDCFFFSKKDLRSGGTEGQMEEERGSPIARGSVP